MNVTNMGKVSAVIEAETNLPELTLRSITVRLSNGEETFLNWDFCLFWKDRTTWKCSGVCIGEEYADGRLDELENLEITAIRLNSEQLPENPMLSIKKIEFYDNGKLLTISNPGIKSVIVEPA